MNYYNIFHNKHHLNKYKNRTEMNDIKSKNMSIVNDKL